jgi:toxin CptA
MKSAPTIAFDYRPSRWIGAATLLVCACAALVPWLSAWPLPVCIALSLAAITFGTRALHRFWNPPFHRIAYRASGWSLTDAANEEQAAVLESHAHLGVLLSLGLRVGPGVGLRVLLARDNLDADTRRRLVLLLARVEIVQTR